MSWKLPTASWGISEHPGASRGSLGSLEGFLRTSGDYCWEGYTLYYFWEGSKRHCLKTHYFFNTYGRVRSITIEARNTFFFWEGSKRKN